MFSEFFHELKYLEVPDWLYPRMTRHAGRRNRVLVHEYRAVLDEVLPGYKMLVTCRPSERIIRATRIRSSVAARSIGDFVHAGGLARRRRPRITLAPRPARR